MSALTEKKLSKRTRIIDAAFDLFLSRSVNCTAIDDVVKLAGVAKGTFYLYFKDKYDLLGQIVARKSAELFCVALRSLNAESTVEMTVCDKALYIVGYISDYMLLHRDVTALFDKNFAACFSLLTSPDSGEQYELMNGLISDFTAAGHSKDNALKLIYYIINTTGSLCSDAVLGISPYSIEELMPVISESVEKLLS